MNGGGEEKTGCTREERREPDAQRRLVGSEVRKVVGARYHGGDPAMHHVWQPRQSSEGGHGARTGVFQKRRGACSLT